MHVRSVFLHSRTVVMQNFLPIGIEEIAVGMCPEDFATGEVEGYLFASFGHEPEAGGLIILIHMQRTLGGMFVPKGGAKVGINY